MGDHLDYVLRLFDKGMLSLPLLEGGKHLDFPAMGYNAVHRKTMRKNLKELAFSAICFHLAQQPPSVEEITRWFQGFSGNIGMVGGFDNLLVLDFDHPRHFASWREGRESLVGSTPLARSPSGYHVYLRTSVPLISSSLHFGLRRVGHAKALGGYAVTSPSVLKDGSPYSWIPGQSPLEVDPVTISDLAEVSLSSVSPIKAAYDRFLGRGHFEDS